MTQFILHVFNSNDESNTDLAKAISIDSATISRVQVYALSGLPFDSDWEVIEVPPQIKFTAYIINLMGAPAIESTHAIEANSYRLAEIAAKHIQGKPFQSDVIMFLASAPAPTQEYLNEEYSS